MSHSSALKNHLVFLSAFLVGLAAFIIRIHCQPIMLPQILNSVGFVAVLAYGPSLAKRYFPNTWQENGILILFLSLLSLLSFFMPQTGLFLPLAVGYGLYQTGRDFFAGHKTSTVMAGMLALGFATLFVSVQYNYLHIFLLPELVPVDGAHSDTLFHVALANMIQTYHIPTTGLNGLQAMHYHAGSHWLFGGWAQLLGATNLGFYGLSYLIIVPALLIQASFSFAAVLQKWLRPEKEGIPILPAGLILLVAMADWVPTPLGHLMTMGFYNQIISESFGLSIVFALLTLGCLLETVKEIPLDVPASLSQKLFLWIGLPLLLGFIGFLKISTLFLLIPCLGWAWFRLGLWKAKDWPLTASLAVSGLIAYFVHKSATVQTPYPHEWFALYKHYIPSKLAILYPLAFYLPLLILGASVWLGKRQDEGYRLGKHNKSRWVYLEVCVICALIGLVPDNMIYLKNLTGVYFYTFFMFLAFPALMVDGDLLMRGWRQCRFAPMRHATTGLVVLLLGSSLYNIGSLGYATIRKSHNDQKALAKGLPIPKSLLWERLDRLALMPRAEKADSLVYVEPELKGFEPLVKCRKSFLLIPAVTGLGEIDGLSGSSCPASAPYAEIFQAEPAKQAQTDQHLCATALKDNCHRVIRFGGRGTRVVNCSHSQLESKPHREIQSSAKGND